MAPAPKPPPRIPRSNVRPTRLRVANLAEGTSADADPRRESLLEAASETTERARVLSDAYREWADGWELRGNLLLIAGAILAGAAGTTALTRVIDVIFVGLISLSAAALSTISATLGIAKRVSEHRKAASDCIRISWITREFHRQVENGLVIDKAEAEWKKIVESRNEVFSGKNAMISRRALERAERRDRANAS